MSVVPLNFYDALLNSYDNNPDALNHTGFSYDKGLSNHNQQVYFNQKDNKLLYSVAGTHNAGDLGTDLYMGLGGLKNTQRYKEADHILKEAKRKYNPGHTTLIGSSLGGSIASKLSGDKIYTYNKFSHALEKIIPNEQSYRTSGDLVSYLNPNKNTKTLKGNPKILPIYLPTYRSIATNAYDKHQLKNIKNKNIFI